MLCPYCAHKETKVVDSRESASNGTTRRRRECIKCTKRFTTYERVETDLRIIKKDNRLEQYNRDKLKKGILRACEKRKVSSEIIDQTINRIEATLRAQQGTDIQSTFIGQQIMKELKKIDKVAYIRFASVYRDFTDVDDFKKEISKIKR